MLRKVISLATTALDNSTLVLRCLLHVNKNKKGKCENRKVRVLIDLTLISLEGYRERARSSGQLT